jgi:hypothetical protein
MALCLIDNFTFTHYRTRNTLRLHSNDQPNQLVLFSVRIIPNTRVVFTLCGHNARGTYAAVATALICCAHVTASGTVRSK